MDAFSQQPTLRPCPECGGRRVTGKTAAHLHLRVGLNTGPSSSSQLDTMPFVPVVVCLSCGYISLYAQQLSTLLAEIQKHPDNFRY